MRPIAVVCLLIASCACARKAPIVTPDVRAPERLANADALVRAGCFDCLVSALKEYDALRSVPSVAGVAMESAFRTAALLAIRERELGTEDSGYLARAQQLVSMPTPLLEIADTLPVRGGARQVGDDVELARMQAAYRNRGPWLEYLHAHADENALTAYLWLAFSCTYTPAQQQAVGEWLGALPTWRETPLIAFKAATCAGVDRAAVERLLAADPRFVELNYYVALNAAFTGKIDEAIERLLRAHAWRPRWPSVTSALANDYIALEEYASAVEYFDRTLDVVPNYPDALLGKIRALTYAGRHTDALATVDRLLALEHWYVGDARYWRALNETQLGQYDAAWDDVELAAKLLVNAEVPKLAGIIAYRRKQLDVARAKFDESRERNRDDCETSFYLGVVLAEQGVWTRTADVLVDTASCLDKQERTLTDEIERYRASTEPPARRDRQIAKREQQIANGRRMRAQSWFDVAVAYYSLNRKDDARAYAAKVADDEQFGERARDLLTRLR